MDALGRMAVVVFGAVVAGFSVGTALAVSCTVSAGIIASLTGVGLGVGLVLAAFVDRPSRPLG